MFKPELSVAEVVRMDQMVFEATEAMTKVRAFKGFLKPKHHFSAHASVNTLRMGPMRGYWCYSFEGFHQRVKRIARSSNFFNIAKRVVKFTCMQFGVIFGCRDPKERSRLATLC
jgi:hypothetical protein